MRIAWATPVLQTSAIGRVSADVVAALRARGHVVQVIATEWALEDAPRHAFGADIVSWRSTRREQLAAENDLLVANIGDHFLNHGGLFDLFGALPTLGVFHDFYLFDLLNGWSWSEGRADAEALVRRREVVASVYGQEGISDLAELEAGQLELAEVARRLPMTEWIARYCDAGLCHADFYRKRVLAACPGPVESAAMPVTPRKVAPLTLGASQLVALTVGVMNPNKCVDRVIEAIATSPQLSAQLSYRLVGPISPQESARLTALAEGLSYGGLQIHGAVDDAALDQHLSASDIICCLRRPVLEGASGSAIEGLLAGRPLIVVDAGFYAELPDELVFKIDQEAPVEELRARLEQLCADPALRLASGAAAAAWARRRFDLGGYVAALEGLAAAMVEAKPILRLGADFGRRLASLGLRADDTAVARIGAATSDLFGLVS